MRPDAVHGSDGSRVGGGVDGKVGPFADVAADETVAVLVGGYRPILSTRRRSGAGGSST